METQRPSAILVHHFFRPDDDVSGRYFSQIAEELVRRNWEVTVLTSNRYCRYPSKTIIEQREAWRGVNIIRTNRPPWNQANKYARLASSLWLIIAWVLKLRALPPADVIIMGSNPQFAALMCPLLRFYRRYRLIVHWCHDLYPEAIEADGASPGIAWLSRQARAIMRKAYTSVDLMVDIGACMRRRLDSYQHPGHPATLVPWAFVEPDSLQPADPKTRHELFGDAKLGILYSGTMGRAHDFSLFLELARSIYLEEPGVSFCFGCRGNRYDELVAAITPGDHNIRIAPFAEESQLEKRLNAADLHLLSLRPGWEGIVVPSKFFGSLAVGKPVIYSGPEESGIAQWIREFEVGWVLTKDNLTEVKEKIIELANAKEKLIGYQEKAIQAYNLHFSKEHILNRWDAILRGLLLSGKKKGSPLFSRPCLID